MPRLGSNLSRTSTHRRSVLRTLVSQLIEHQQIRTTWVKAKLTARETEKVITWAKKNTTLTVRKAQGYVRPWMRLRNRLFDTLASRYASREGGYTRIHRIGFRGYDHAPLAVIELVDSPNDIARAISMRTVARELAAAHLSKTHSVPHLELISQDLGGSMSKMAEEQARELLLGNGSSSIAPALAPMTRHNLAKALSPIYAAAFPHCQREPPLSDEEISRRNMERKRTTPLYFNHSPIQSQSSKVLPPSSLSTEQNNVAVLENGSGPYTTFFQSLRVHYRRQLAALQKQGFTSLQRGSSPKSIRMTQSSMQRRKVELRQRSIIVKKQNPNMTHVSSL